MFVGVNAYVHRSELSFKQGREWLETTLEVGHESTSVTSSHTSLFYTLFYHL